MTDWNIPDLAGNQTPCELWSPNEGGAHFEARLVWDSGVLRLWAPSGPDLPATPILLHGRTDSGHDFTVPRAICIDRFTGLDIIAHHGVTAGPHLNSPEHEFIALRIRISGLGRLSGWPTPTALADGGHLSLHGADPGAWIQLTGLQARSQKLLDRTFVVPLLSLAKLAMSSQPHLLEMQVQEANSHDWRSIYRGAVPGPDVPPPVPLLSIRDLTVEVVAAWLNMVESFDSVPAVIARLVGHRDTLDLEPTVLQLTTAAEGLSRRLDLKDRMTVEEAKVIQRGAVEGALKVDPSRGEMVGGYLSHIHEPSFGERLIDLAERADTAVPGITGDRAKWKKLVYNARNDFAHRAKKVWLSDDAIERYFIVAHSLPWVLRTILLLEAGVPADVLRERTTSNLSYQAFLSNCSEYEPGPYAPKR